MTDQRRLAAILVADVVGYSKLVGSDEAGTLTKLQTLRSSVIEPAIAKHAGRLFKAVGDGFLVEFASAVQAVEAARAIQQANADGDLRLRIGIHVGDVVVQGDDLMGDGVNVAARIESVADAGGIAISRQVRDQVRDKLDVELVDKGEVELKNIARPVRIFTVAGRAPTKASHLGRQGRDVPAPALPDKPSIAVLPFQNMSGDPEQEYFADGIVEDIITALSRFKSLFVIARNSSFTYKGKAMDVRQVGRELGVRYVLEGSVRKAGGQVRITGQLIEASTGEHLWAERYDRNLSDVFTLQDEITVRIATAVDPAIRDAQTKAALRKHPTDLGAWDHLLRGLWHLNLFRQAANEDGRREFLAAIESDPDFAPAHATLAISHVFDAWFNWTEAHAASLERAHKAAAFAVKLDPQEPLAHVATALACFWTGRMEQAKSSAELAISLNPNSFLANYTCGVARNYLGECEAAVPYHLKALDLSPNDPLAWNCLGSLAHTHFNLGKFNDAVDCANRAIVLRHGYLFGRVVKTAALGHEGRRDEAAASLRAIFDISPDFSLRKLEHYPFVLDSQRRHLFAGLEKAGLPITPTVASLPAVELALPDKPSIAVLPFQNMSGDPEQEYFADGLAEDLITGLSRVSWLFVIARNSSFAFRGEKLDVRTIGERLGVRYLVEGSVRRAGQRLRLTVQLIEAATGNHLWADRHDGSLEDVFDFQDRIVASLIGAIEPKLRATEIARARRKRPDNLDAYDLYLRALPLAATAMPQDADKALRLLEEAIRLEPHYAVVHGFMAWCHEQRYLRGGLHTETREAARRHAYAAIEAGTDDAMALAMGGFVVGVVDRDYAIALDALDRSIALSPSSALAFGFSSIIRAWMGDCEIAIEHSKMGIRLSPYDPLIYLPLVGLAYAHFFAGNFVEAARAASRASVANPRFSVPCYLHTAALVQLGRREEAESMAKVLLELQPGFTVSGLVSGNITTPQQMELLAGALRQVGLPE